MRRWKVIDGGNGYFHYGDIITKAGEEVTSWFWLPDESDFWAINLCCLVEIDENGNTIRTYKAGDKLDEGTLVGGTMNKVEAKKRLDAIEAETKALREILEKPDGIVYDSDKIYIAINLEIYRLPFILMGHNGHFFWYSLETSEAVWTLERVSGQEAIGKVISDGFIVRTFSKRDDALKFMMECK